MDEHRNARETPSPAARPMPARKPAHPSGGLPPSASSQPDGPPAWYRMKTRPKHLPPSKLDELKHLVDQITARHRVEMIILFGSHARGDWVEDPECLAAYHYGLELLPASSPGVDAVKDGRNIEIKATQGQRVALRSGPPHLLALRLNREGGFSEVYNGPGDIVWRQFEGKTKRSNGQFQISLSRLTALMQGVPPELRLPMISPNKTLQPTLG